ncbi:MAG: CBS domain-containing protein [Nitrospiria bacterium]
MSLSSLIHREITHIAPEATITDAARMMRDQKIGSVFIQKGGEFIGIVTDSDLVRKVFTKALPLDTPVTEVMSAPIIDIDIEKSVMDANHLMYFNGIRHLAISENEKIIGMISVRDLVKFFLSAVEGPMDKMVDVIKPLTVLTRRIVETIDASSTAKEAAKKMGENKIGSLMITDNGNYTGIVTEADLVRKVMGYRMNASEIPVGVIMNTPIVDIDINASVQSATERMEAKGIRHLGVSEDGRVIGILSIRDLIGMIAIRDLPRFVSE